MIYLFCVRKPQLPSSPKNPCSREEKIKKPSQLSQLMAADNCVTCFLGAMDRLWFHQIVIFSEPSDTKETSSQITEKIKCKGSQKVVDTEQTNSPVGSLATDPKDETSNQESDEKEETNCEERTTRLNLVSSKSPAPRQKGSRSIGRSTRRLQKTMSLKSLVELELEEVKGFMDLGFMFEKETINYRMMSLIPGLQRLDACKKEVTEHSSAGFDNNSSYNDDNDDDSEKEDEDHEETKGAVMRPYLSEAWLIKKPDSPLLNMRIPRVFTNADMKRHLRYWARTVASEIQQESE